MATIAYDVIAWDAKGKELGRVQVAAACYSTARRYGRKLLWWNLAINAGKVSCYKRKAVAA